MFVRKELGNLSDVIKDVLQKRSLSRRDLLGTALWGLVMYYKKIALRRELVALSTSESAVGSTLQGSA